MKVLDLFSGISAPSVAWHPLGWKTLAFAEIEPFPCSALAHHYPDTPNLGDVSQHEQWPEMQSDVVVGGSPCQAFSVAGLRKGLDDPRGNLTLTYLAVVDQYRPTWVVWENVPGVLSIDKGRTFGTFLGALGQLGYGFAYRVLDAIHFGCACPRPRVFVVGHFGDWRKAAAALFQRKCFEWDRAKTDQRLQVGTAPVFTRLGAMAYDDRTPCVLEPDGARRASPLEWERALGFPDGYTEIQKTSRRIGPKQQKRMESSAPLRDDTGAVPENVGIAEQLMCHLRGRDEKACCRPRSLQRASARDSLSRMQYKTPGDRRRGMDDARNGLFVSGVADGPRYKALGNSMAVPVVRWIGERIQAVQEIPA